MALEHVFKTWVSCMSLRGQMKSLLHIMTYFLFSWFKYILKRGTANYLQREKGNSNIYSDWATVVLRANFCCFPCAATPKTRTTIQWSLKLLQQMSVSVLKVSILSSL